MDVCKILLNEANNYANYNNSSIITVVTQEKNERAMAFYLKNGFNVKNRTYIYHLWKKNN
jgi:ribosomal protein S18 acetylase RimI-like enzyme